MFEIIGCFISEDGRKMLRVLIQTKHGNKIIEVEDDHIKIDSKSLSNTEILNEPMIKS